VKNLNLFKKEDNENRGKNLIGFPPEKNPGSATVSWI